MIEAKIAGLDVASRRPQAWFGFSCGLESCRGISHQVTQLELQDPVEALHDGNPGPQQGGFVADKAFVRSVASERRDEMLNRKQDIVNVRISLLSDERQ